jgi:ABC-type nitrate/sulfonate/bicarbonate transport system substrate-binding protein
MRTLIALAVVAAVSILSWGTPLKVSLPPAMGAVPIVMGTAWGFFQEEGVEVELIPLPSQRDRMLAFQAGQVDVMVMDLTGALLLLSSVPKQAVIVGTAYIPNSAGDHLAFITPPTFSKIKTWDELVDRIRGGGRVQIALPRQSDLEFVADELFRQEGLAVPADLYIGQDNLLDNSTWTLLGMVAVGALPQPYVDYILSYSYPGKPALEVLKWVPGGSFPPEVFVVRRPLIESQPEVLTSFFSALRRAVDGLNSEDRDEVVATALPLAVNLFFPGGGPQEAADPEVRAEIEKGIAAIVIPSFSPPEELDPEMYERVMMWAVGKKYLRSPIPYDTAVAPPPG